MLKEYALQPELLSSWPVFRYLSDKFGYGRGRVIARYPKRWEKMVYDALGNCMPMEKQKIVEGLVRLKPALYPRPHEWDKDKGWLDNAIEEHTKRAFCAIIAQYNPNGVAAIIRESDLDEGEEPRWKAERQRHIERTDTAMAGCADLLLRYAREILFIEPHFNPQLQRFMRPLKAFLQIVATRPSYIPVRRIEIHTGHKTVGAKAFFDTVCTNLLPSIIPRGIKIRLIRWDQDYLHNRFILTENGGLKFAIGLDDHNDSARKHDIVDLLEPEPYAKTWQEYQRGSPRFPLMEDDLIIEGTASFDVRRNEKEG
jgi:hypothetical protein